MDAEYHADVLDGEADRLERELNKHVRAETRLIKSYRAKAKLLRTKIAKDDFGNQD